MHTRVERKEKPFLEGEIISIRDLSCKKSVRLEKGVDLRGKIEIRLKKMEARSCIGFIFTLRHFISFVRKKI